MTSTKKVRLRRIVEAWESGAIVNPDGLRNQVMGAVVQAIGGALFETIQFKDGRILNPHFALYRVPRFGDAPEIDVVLIDRKDLPSAGAGETGIVGLAPAVSNAGLPLQELGCAKCRWLWPLYVDARGNPFSLSPGS